MTITPTYVPRHVNFDRYSQESGGLEVVTTDLIGSLLVRVNGLGVVTGWLSTGPWAEMFDQKTITWSAGFTPVTTSWVAGFTPVTTTWTRF